MSHPLYLSVELQDSIKRVEGANQTDSGVKIGVPQV